MPMQALIHHGIAVLGRSHVAFAQFLGCTFLSAILDNNVVADFASRALHNLDLSTLFLFAMAQISGYALGDVGLILAVHNRWWLTPLFNGTLTTATHHWNGSKK